MSEKNKTLKIDWESTSMQIITFAGSAKSDAMEAITLAKKGAIEKALSKLKHAESEITEATKAHFDVISAEANGQKLEYRVLFIHAEDQLLTTQTIILLAAEFITLYQRLLSVETNFK